MVAFNKIYAFVADIGTGVHNLNTGALTYALTTMGNKPTSASTTLGGLTTISPYTNLSARVPTNSGYSQSGGVGKLVLQDLVLTASGAVAPFGVVVLYNDTAASDQLIGWWEYGSDVTMASSETFTIDADTSNGILTLS